MSLPSAGPTDCSSGLSARIFNNLRYDNPWRASQSGVAVGALCCPTVPNGIGFRCSAITTGITGGSEPTWPLVLGNTVVDGGVTWTAQDVANPSGKAHSVNFGYVFTSADLDGFRLLAYNTARAVADELNSDFSAARYNSNAAQALTQNAFTIINFATVEADTDSAVTTGASWHFTCPSGKDGLYAVDAAADLNGANSGDNFISVMKNGVEFRRGMRIPGGGLGNIALSLSAKMPLAAGDTLDVRVYTTVAGTDLGTGSTAVNWIDITRVFGS